MSANILVVEDEAPIALLIRYNLQAEGFNVDVVDRAEDAEIAMQDQRPDLIVLDWMLPGISGIELCRRVRANRELRDIPIILLTARGEESDRIRGFETGADDYMPKPFSVPELIARVRAILRRSSPERVANVLEVGDIALNRDEHRVTRSGRDVRLGPTEFKLLEFFLESPGRVFTRTQLLDGVWGRDVYVDERTVDVHIGRLRKALIRGNEFNPIRTIRGSGYALTDKEQNIPN
ncbi:MAG: phosphate regulon transcriptional regulator PhoB [Pseudomonadota bacterium]